MKKIQLFLFVVIMLCFSLKGFSQKGNYRITNGIGLMGTLTKFDISTNNFITEQQNGFLVGASATVDIPYKWYNISYSMQLSENNMGISARPTLAENNLIDFITYRMFAAQFVLMSHIKIVKNDVTFDLGPMLQYNGRLEPKDKSKETFYINNYNNLLAKDISNISNFNFNGVVGASAGYKYVKLRAQYIYSFTNILKKLNTQNLDTTGGPSSFKGNLNILVLGALISF